MEKLKLSNQVQMLVVEDGTVIGVIKDVESLPYMLETYVDESDLTTEYLTENIKLYPLLSTEPMDVMYEVEREYVVDSSTDRRSSESWYIEDIDEEFDKESELHDFIKNALEEEDYDEEDVNDWDITYREHTSVSVNIGYEDVKLKVWGADRSVGAYVMEDEIAELIEDLEDFEEADFEHLGDAGDVVVEALPQPVVYTSNPDLAYVTHYSARSRVREGKYVYIMTDNTGLPTNLLADVDDAIAQGKSFARLIQD